MKNNKNIVDKIEVYGIYYTKESIKDLLDEHTIFEKLITELIEITGIKIPEKLEKRFKHNTISKNTTKCKEESVIDA